MNYQSIIDQVFATSDSNEAKSFALGLFLAAAVRIVRFGIRLLKTLGNE